MKLFTEHPNSVGETYLQHYLVAVKLSLRLSSNTLPIPLPIFSPFSVNELYILIYENKIIKSILNSNYGIKCT